MRTPTPRWNSPWNGNAWPRVMLLAAVSLFASPLASPLAAAAEPGLERQTELLYFLKHDCGSCHGLARKGGLGSPLLPENLGARDDDDLVGIILDGIPGTPMPPWRALLTEGEVRFMVKSIKEGTWRQ